MVLMSSVLTVAAVMSVPYALVDLGGNDWEVVPALALAGLGAVGTGIAYWIMAALVGRVGSIRSSYPGGHLRHGVTITQTPLHSSF